MDIFEEQGELKRMELRSKILLLTSLAPCHQAKLADTLCEEVWMMKYANVKYEFSTLQYTKLTYSVVQHTLKDSDMPEVSHLFYLCVFMYFLLLSFF